MTRVQKRIRYFLCVPLAAIILITATVILSVFSPSSKPAFAWSGSGTSSSPYLLTTVSDLQTLATNVNNGTTYSGSYFRLNADLDINPGYIFGDNGTAVSGPNSLVSWNPIGNSTSRYFKGNFDGNNKTISGIYINSSNTTYRGLFGAIQNATVQNLNIVNSYIYGSNYVGAVASYVYTSTVTHCTTNARVRGSNYVGGIAGYAYDSSNFTFCGNMGNIAGTSYIGGILGYAQTSTGNSTKTITINNSFNSGTITNSSTGGGGLIGYGNFQNYYTSSSSASCSNCGGDGRISGSYSCSTCSGSGKVDKSVTCSTCSGSGKNGYGSHSVYLKYFTSGPHSGGKIGGIGNYRWQCSACGATTAASILDSGTHSWGKCDKNRTNTYGCQNCSIESTNYPSGTCYGTQVNCSRCSGTGSTTTQANCTRCGGDGRISSSSSCSRCSGSGSISTVTYPNVNAYLNTTYCYNKGTASQVVLGTLTADNTNYMNHNTTRTYYLSGSGSSSNGGTSLTASQMQSTSSFAGWNFNSSAWAVASGINDGHPVLAQQLRTLTFSPNGGSVNPTTRQYLVGATYGTLPTPTRTGYTFGGWFADSGLSKAVTASQVAGLSNHTLYAKFTANSYKLAMDYSGYPNKVGGLAGGFEQTGWRDNLYDTTHVRTGNYAYKITASASVPEATVPTANAVPIDATTKSHVYYFQYWGYQETLTPNATTQIYWPIEEPSMGQIPLGPAGQWNKYSFHGKRANNPLGASKQVRIDFDNRNTAGVLWVDDFLMLDLTEIFGAGNEPGKAWCDKHIASGTAVQTMTYDTTSNLHAKSTTSHINLPGYEFKGWSSSPKSTATELTPTYTDGAGVKNLATSGTVNLYAVWNITHFQITATAGENGTISPGTSTVDYDSSHAFRIQANAKYKISTVTVDGAPVNFNPTDAILETYVYNFNNVTQNHTIEATFELKVNLTVNVRNSQYREGVYLYVSEFDPFTTTPETVTFYAKEMPGFKFYAWRDKKGNIVSTHPYQTFEFNKDDAYHFYADVGLIPPTDDTISVHTAADLVKFVNWSKFMPDHLANITVRLNNDIDITNLDLYTLYKFPSFPVASEFAGTFDFNGYNIIYNGKYYNPVTGATQSTPFGHIISNDDPFNGR